MTEPDVIDVVVPDIGDFADVPIIEILVASGDRVQVDDPLVTLESDKATMDVPSPFAGAVKELKVKVGDRVAQGTLLLSLATGHDRERTDSGDGDANGRANDVTAQTKASAVTSQAAPVEALAPDSVASAVAAEASDGEDGDRQPPAGDGSRSVAAFQGHVDSEPIYASPSVRRVARERGVDLGQVEGTGRKGRITREDVEGFSGAPSAAGQPTTEPARIAGLELAPWPSIDFEKFGAIERRPRSRIQKISAPSLARNWVMIPHVTHNDEADITELEAFRKQMNEELARDGVKLTIVGFLIAASVATLKEFPEFNASLDGDELVIKRYYNIGFAADTPGGLLVPVIKDADGKGIVDIARELTSLSAKAREGKLGPGEMEGGTFTISSLGGIGGTSFTPIVNAPEVAILGVTRSAVKPVWRNGEFAPRLIVPLSLSYDHRVIDGAAAARFTAHLVKVLSDLRRALL